MKAEKKWVLGIFVISFFISLYFDKNILRFFEIIRNPYLDYVMNWFSNYISVFLILVIITSLFLWEERKREWILVLWLSFFVTLALSLFFKNVFMRPRPEIIDAGYSLPSNHASTSFSAVAVLDKEFKMLKWFWIGFAGLVALSRVYVSAHYLSDVIMGGLLGYGVGSLFIYLEDKYKLFRISRIIKWIKK